jgi:cytochrome P450
VAVGETGSLDRERLRELFDIRGGAHSETVGDYEGDPYPIWRDLRERATVHPGTLHELTGFYGPIVFQGLPFEDRPHFTAFTYAACDEAFKDSETFTSSLVPVDIEHGQLHPFNSMMTMSGTEHRRYRSLVQPSFVVPRMAWWRSRWIEKIVHQLIDGFIDDGKADLNVDFCAAIPILTITGSFGIDVEQALELREALLANQRRGLLGGKEPEESGADRFVRMLRPIIDARRESPEDDLISVLVTAELKDEDGQQHRLSDREILSFANLLLHAGSGTTWRQLGIALVALLERPQILDVLRQDRKLLRNAAEEAVRWMPIDPMFSRFVTKDVDFHGAHLPNGSVLHLALGAASRDPSRWERPDEFDVTRPLRPALGFGGGSHICLGMHLARTEMEIGIGALLDRLPNLRLDPEEDRPRIVGMYHRGPTAIPVQFG